MIRSAIIVLCLAVTSTASADDRPFDAAKIVRDAGAAYGSQPKPEPTPKSTFVCRPDPSNRTRTICEEK